MKQLLILALPLFLFSCYSSPVRITHFRGIALTIPYHIQIGEALSHANKEAIKKLIDHTFAETDRLYNHWNPQSELSRVNQASCEMPIPLSSELATVLTLAKEATLLTEGRYDPTLGALIQLWKESLKKGETPSPDTKTISGWEQIVLDQNTLTKKNPEVAIDLDGMIKGYSVDILSQKLDELGYFSHYVDWGGDIKVSKSHPSKRRWQVLVHSPIDEGEVIPLSNCALASSGDYEQIWETATGKYTHILSPETGRAIKRNAGSIAAVTVQAPSCALADALATACMTFSSIAEVEIWTKAFKEEQLNNVNFWIFSYEN